MEQLRRHVALPEVIDLTSPDKAAKQLKKRTIGSIPIDICSPINDSSPLPQNKRRRNNGPNEIFPRASSDKCRARSDTCKTTPRCGNEAVICLLDSSDDDADDDAKISAASTVTATATSSVNAPAASAPSPFADSVRGRLDHEKKQEHFVDARRPEKLLQDEISHLWDQIRRIPSRYSEDYRKCKKQIDELQDKLSDARRNAADDIFNRNNSAGQMGFDSAGEIVVDFHGLYLKDAIEKYKDMILPILPVQSKCAIITGRGRHSGGRSVLRDGLYNHICHSNEGKSELLQCKIDEKNSGRILLRWTG